MRYCDLHKDIARQYVDDGSMGEQSTVKQTGNNKENDLLIVQILNEKETRQGGLFEVISYSLVPLSYFDMIYINV